MAACYKVMPLTTFQMLMTLKLLLNLRANLITKMNSLILNFPPHIRNFKAQKLPLGIKLLQNAPNGTKIMQDFPNDKKILQIYRM